MRMLSLLTQGFSARRQPPGVGDYVTPGSQQGARSPPLTRLRVPRPVAVRLAVDHLQEREQHPLSAEGRPDNDGCNRDGDSDLPFPASTVHGRRAPQAEEVGQEDGAVLGGAVALLLPAGGRLLVVVPAQ